MECSRDSRVHESMKGKGDSMTKGRKLTLQSEALKTAAELHGMAEDFEMLGKSNLDEPELLDIMDSFVSQFSDYETIIETRYEPFYEVKTA